MSRKRSAYRPRPKGIPMLIGRGLVNDSIELTERQAVEAFAGGWADAGHFDYLADMRDCMMLAAAHKDDQGALAICRAMLIVMDNIRIQHQATGRFTVAGDEVLAMRLFADSYKDFWLRQPAGLYDSAVAALDKMRERGVMTVNVEKQKH